MTSHTEDGLQQLVSRLSHACKEFGLTISLKKTNVIAQGTDHSPTIAIDGYNLEAVENFTYLGSSISSSLSIDAEVNSRIAKAAIVMARLKQRVWNNPSLAMKTKMHVYQACVLSILLYSNEAWTTYASQERKLNSFHLWCLRRILHIQWQDKVPNTEVLDRANMKTMFSILSERRLRWLGHVRRMEHGRIPKDLLYGELTDGSRPTRRPRLPLKDVCKKDMKLYSINISTWESCVEDCLAWRLAIRQDVQKVEEARNTALVQKRAKRKERQRQPQPHLSHAAEIVSRVSGCTATRESADRPPPHGSYTIVSREDGRMPTNPTTSYARKNFGSERG